MEISYSIELHPKVVKNDIPNLDPALRIAIRDTIREKLTREPEVFGKPLRQSLKGCRTLRAGDYRVIFRIQGRKVSILAILHRSGVYQEMERRL